MWKYTKIHHPARIAMGITVNEYCVLDILYQSQVSERHGVNGWAGIGCHKIARFLGVSASTVFEMFERFEGWGLLEFGEGRRLKRVAPVWGEVAYRADGAGLADVRKVDRSVRKRNARKRNGNRSVSERQGARSPNGKRSVSERITKGVESNGKEREVLPPGVLGVRKSIIGFLEGLFSPVQWTDMLAGAGLPPPVVRADIADGWIGRDRGFDVSCERDRRGVKTFALRWCENLSRDVPEPAVLDLGRVEEVAALFWESVPRAISGRAKRQVAGKVAALLGKGEGLEDFRRVFAEARSLGASYLDFEYTIGRYEHLKQRIV